MAAAPSSLKSTFLKTVCLSDWWLIKSKNDSEGKNLAVSGYYRVTKELLPARAFCSAPIVKVRDLFYLETADGIHVVLEGMINKPRTIENGFSNEIFNHFLIGFPTYWAELAEKFSPGNDVSPTVYITISSPTFAEAAPSCKRVTEVTFESNFVVEDTEATILAKEQENIHHGDCHESSPNVSVKLKNETLKKSYLKNSESVTMVTSRVEIEISEENPSSKTRLRKDTRKRKENPTSVGGDENDSQVVDKSGKKTKRKSSFAVQVTPKDKAKMEGLISSLDSYKRSRSGRKLVPRLQFWRNQVAVYDMDHGIVGIQEDLPISEPSRGSRSEPPPKKRRR